MDSTFDCQSNLMDWLFLLCKMVTLSLREEFTVQKYEKKPKSLKNNTGKWHWEI